MACRPTDLPRSAFCRVFLLRSMLVSHNLVCCHRLCCCYNGNVRFLWENLELWPPVKLKPLNRLPHNLSQLTRSIRQYHGPNLVLKKTIHGGLRAIEWNVTFLWCFYLFEVRSRITHWQRSHDRNSKFRKFKMWTVASYMPISQSRIIWFRWSWVCRCVKCCREESLQKVKFFCF